MSQEGKAFLANASHPSLGDAEAAGKLFAGEGALVFESAAGAVELPYEGLEIGFGTKQDPRVTFTNESRPECTITASNEDILREFVFHRNNRLRRQIEEHREHVEGVRRLVLTGVFFAAFVSLSAGLGAAVEWALPRLIDQVPVKFEKELGEENATKFTARFKTLKDTSLTAQVNAIVQRLAKTQPNPGFEYKVTIIDTPMVNAFALPGGNIFVFSGFLRLCTNSTEVAGVLAHEMAHVTKRHGLRKMLTQLGPAYAVRGVLGDNHGVLSGLAQSSTEQIGLSFSRDFEREADNAGFDIMVAANLDPRGLENALKRMAADEERMLALLKQLGISGRERRSLMSHPPSQERINHLAARWSASAKKSGFTPLEPLKLTPVEKGGSPLDKLFQ
jgi:Zn-dependent protease with chaperone function